MTQFFLWSMATASAILPASYLLGGVEEVARSLVAAALCLFLTAVNLRITLWALPRGGNWALASVLGGSLVRMMLVLTIAFALFWFVPVLGTVGFLLWVTFFYLWTLGLEVWQSVEGLKKVNGQPQVAT